VTINLKEGRPYVEEALRHMNRRLYEARKDGISVVRLIQVLVAPSSKEYARNLALRYGWAQSRSTSAAKITSIPKSVDACDHGFLS
jgi:hypothetical protein